MKMLASNVPQFVVTSHQQANLERVLENKPRGKKIHLFWIFFFSFPGRVSGGALRESELK